MSTDKSTLQRWFDRQTARQDRMVLLEQAVIGNRWWAYAWYRLRFFLANYVVEAASHAVVAVSVLTTLGWDNVVLVVVGHSAATLVSHLWWGALESLRTRVRELHRAAKPHRIAPVIARWLTLSLLLGAVVLGIGLAWTGWHLVAATLGVAEAFLASQLLRIALDLPARAYHSGIYGMRRVYKPLGATLAPNLAGLAAVLTLAPAVGTWAVVIAAVITTVMATAFTVIYTGRMYRFLGMAPRPVWRGAVLREVVDRTAIGSGIANTVIGLDALLVLAMIGTSGRGSGSFIALYLLMPAVTAGADWARLLYFDLKRLELRLFANVRRRFERQTLWLALLLGVVFWLVAAVILTASGSAGGAAMYASLLLFFCGRSLLARAQLAAFAEQRYLAVIATGSGCLAGFAAVGPLIGDEDLRMAAIALLCLAGAVGLARWKAMRGAAGQPRAMLTLEWLQRVAATTGTVRIGSARIAVAAGPDRLDTRSREDANRWRLTQLADRTTSRLGPDGAATWVGPDRLIWLEPAGTTRPVDAAWLQRTSGGQVLAVRTVTGPDAAAVLADAAATGLLGAIGPDLAAAVTPVDAAAASRRFRELIPGGLVYALDRPVPAGVAALPAAEHRAILADATAYARDLRIRRRQSRFDVTPLCAGGELQLIFIGDPAGGRRARTRWQHHIKALNLHAAVAGTMLSDTKGRTRSRSGAGRRPPR